MARGLEDLMDVAVPLIGHISLDMERVESDPIYQQYLMVSESPTEALGQYIVFYVTREAFLQRVPSTNGPGHLAIAGDVVIQFMGESYATDNCGDPTECA